MKHSKILVLAFAIGLVLAPGCGSDKTTQAPAPPDDASPLPPSGLQAMFVVDGTAELTWTPNAEPDLAGYRVYLYDPAPTRESAYQLQNRDALLTESSYAVVVSIESTLWIRVTAVDQGGNESGATAPFEVQWQLPPADHSGGGKPPLPGVQEPGVEPRGGGSTSPPGGSRGDRDGEDTPPGDDPGQH